MLQILDEFRDKLDEIMLQAMHSRVALYGYESYTGRFIKWYAQYYHNIQMDYLISVDMTRGRAYDQEIFRPSVIDFNYKDIKNAIIWVVEPLDEALRIFLEERGYVKDKTYFDFFEKIYGNDVYGEENSEANVFLKKNGKKRYSISGMVGMEIWLQFCDADTA